MLRSWQPLRKAKHWPQQLSESFLLCQHIAVGVIAHRLRAAAGTSRRQAIVAIIAQRRRGVVGVGQALISRKLRKMSPQLRCRLNRRSSQRI